MHKKFLKSVLALALVFSVNISTMNCVTASAQTSIQEDEDYKIHIVNVEDGTETVSDLPDESDLFDFVSEPISPIFSNVENNDTGISPNAVIGDDNRTLVSNPSVFPYSCIARLYLTYEDGSAAYGTGAMISTNLLATAGHCLINSNGSRLATVQADFGKNGSSYVYRASDLSTYIYYGGYSGYDPNTDYGFIVFNSNISSHTGAFGVNTSASLNQVINITGYPGDIGSCEYMYTGSGVIQAITTDLITHNVDTAGGQSGAPVYVYSNGNPYLIGMHSGSGGSVNYARRLTDGLYSWLKQNGYL